MNGVLIDSNIILDIFEDNQEWADWSENILNHYCVDHNLFINSIIYSEISIGFEKIEELEKAITECGFQLLPIPREALFLAGKAFVKYKKRNGNKLSPLPDFYIGAHAAVTDLPLITRDTSRVKSYFPTVDIISPG